MAIVKEVIIMIDKKRVISNQIEELTDNRKLSDRQDKEKYNSIQAARKDLKPTKVKGWWNNQGLFPFLLHLDVILSISFCNIETLISFFKNIF